MTQLDKLVKQFNKKFNEQLATKGVQENNEIQKIPFSSSRANYTTYGGVPRGRLIEFFGDEGSGKTTSALDICANAQKLFDKEYKEELKSADESRKNYLKQRGVQRVVYCDCENTLDEVWAKKIKVNLDTMYILKPQSETAEEIFQMILEMIDTDEVGLVVIDSLAVMLSQQAYEEDMLKKTYGGIAMPLTLFSKKAQLLCAKYNCTLIGINQMRENLSSPYGGEKTTGGKAWKHNCSLRIRFAKGDFIDENNKEIPKKSESPKGNIVLMNIAKTKVCKPDRKVGFYTLNYEKGIDEINDLIDTAIQFDIIHKTGAWLTIINDNGEIMYKFQGKASAMKKILEDEKLKDYLNNKVLDMIM
jgi:recombination protein RecA